jgi:hypothetical protein
VSSKPEYDSFKVLQAECPRCGAKSGENCHSTTGKPAPFHIVRKAAVYPRFGKKQTTAKRNSATGKQGVEDSNPQATRRVLRREVIAAAMRYSGADGGYDPAEEPSRSDALFKACQALSIHRAHHPNIRG